MSHVKALRCRECSREYPPEALYVCDFCFGPLEVIYDYQQVAERISRERIARGPYSMWRYEDLLPVHQDKATDINAGFTPLVKARNLGRLLGLEHLYLKNDSVNPSFSFKDRVVSVAVSKAREFGYDTVACASTGNLANSVAAHAARAGMQAFVFVPADLERGKMVGAAIYGATLVAVEGNYDEVNRLCAELADSYPWAFVNINLRPYYAEGSKTLGFEVVEQLGWQTPDHVVVPVASGSMFTKIWKGLQEFHHLGLVDHLSTRMHVTQPAGCAPIVDAFRGEAGHIHPVKPNTLAKSLAIGNPADGLYALQTLRASGGTALAIPEEEIPQGIKLLAETEGIFTEPAGGVVVAGLKRLVEQGVIKRDELVVALITGNGLKTQEVVEDVVRPVSIKPTLSSFQEALKARKDLGLGGRGGQ